jgi:hypothetical protein
MFSLKLPLNGLMCGKNYIFAVGSLKSDVYDKVPSEGEKVIMKKKQQEQAPMPPQSSIRSIISTF